jgi:hypothetical protein
LEGNHISHMRSLTFTRDVDRQLRVQFSFDGGVPDRAETIDAAVVLRGVAEDTTLKDLENEGVRRAIELLQQFLDFNTGCGEEVR